MLYRGYLRRSEGKIKLYKVSLETGDTGRSFGEQLTAHCGCVVPFFFLVHFGQATVLYNGFAIDHDGFDHAGITAEDNTVYGVIAAAGILQLVPVHQGEIRRHAGGEVTDIVTAQGGSAAGPDVVDADYEVVDDDKK